MDMEDMEKKLAEETETIKVVKEELESQISQLKATYEQTINNLNKAHADQIREILRSGHTQTQEKGNATNGTYKTDNYDDDDEDEDGISQRRVQMEIDKLNKKLRMW